MKLVDSLLLAILVIQLVLAASAVYDDKSNCKSNCKCNCKCQDSVKCPEECADGCAD